MKLDDSGFLDWTDERAFARGLSNRQLAERLRRVSVNYTPDALVAAEAARRLEEADA